MEATNSVPARRSGCPAAGRRRKRCDPSADHATAEDMPPPRRTRDQPADEVVVELSAAPADEASSTEAAGENSTTPPSPNRPGMRGSAFLSYSPDMLRGRLPTPQDLPRRRAPDTRCRRAPRSGTRSCRRSRCAPRSCSRARAGRRSRRASTATPRLRRSRRTASSTPPSWSWMRCPTCSLHPLSTVATLWQRPRAVFASGGGRPPASAHPAEVGQLPGRLRGAQRAQGLEHMPYPPHPALAAPHSVFLCAPSDAPQSSPTASARRPASRPPPPPPSAAPTTCSPTIVAARGALASVLWVPVDSFTLHRWFAAAVCALLRVGGGSERVVAGRLVAPGCAGAALRAGPGSRVRL